MASSSSMLSPSVRKKSQSSFSLIDAIIWGAVAVLLMIIVFIFIFAASIFAKIPSLITNLVPYLAGSSSSGNGSGINGNQQFAQNNSDPICTDLKSRVNKYDPNVSTYITQAANKYNIPITLLTSQLEQESNFYPKAQSSVGAQGIAQFMPGTAAQYGVNVWDPQSSIEGQAHFMSDLYKNLGSWDLALAGYNAGAGNVQKYHGIPPFPETQAYVKDINARIAKYKNCFGEGTTSGSTTAPTNPGSQTATSLAQQIQGNSRIKLATIHVSSRNLQSTASSNIQQLAAGKEAGTDSCSGRTSTPVSTNVLSALLSIAGQYTIDVSEIAGGCHSAGSAHYSGRALDIDAINGQGVSSSNSNYRNVMNMCKSLGASLVLGPGSPGHDTHVHCQWSQ